MLEKTTSANGLLQIFPFKKVRNLFKTISYCTEANENNLKHSRHPSNGMGNVQSTGQEASHLAGQLANRHGFQILRVHANSPVSEVQVFPYFDYIIAINGVIVVRLKGKFVV